LAAAGTLGGIDCARDRDFEKTAAMAEIAVVANNLRRLNRPKANWGDAKLYLRLIFTRSKPARQRCP